MTSETPISKPISVTDESQNGKETHMLLTVTELDSLPFTDWEHEAVRPTNLAERLNSIMHDVADLSNRRRRPLTDTTDCDFILCTVRDITEGADGPILKHVLFDAKDLVTNFNGSVLALGTIPDRITPLISQYVDEKKKDCSQAVSAAIESFDSAGVFSILPQLVAQGSSLRTSLTIKVTLSRRFTFSQTPEGENNNQQSGGVIVQTVNSCPCTSFSVPLIEPKKLLMQPKLLGFIAKVGKNIFGSGSDIGDDESGNIKERRSLW